MTTPRVETERLVLRPPRLQDLPACAELLGDYAVAGMLSQVPHPYDLEAGRQRLARSVARWDDWKAADDLAFHVDHDGRLIGGLGFKKLQATPEIGYWLGRPFWGKGFMSEAVHAALGWLFAEFDPAVVACEAMRENEASLHVARKAGFRQVGTVGCDSLARGGSVPAIRAELTREDFFKGH